MAESKPIASLSSGLLARKGQAKPAMRRQGFEAMVGTGPAPLDDLGWNDMGDDHTPSPAREQIEQLREQVESPPAAQRPNPARMLSPEPQSATSPVRPEPEPPELDEEDGQAPVRSWEAEPRTVPPIALRRARREARSRTGRTATGKAAFTLRLDAERHLKLRLAAALERTSAQILVTRALDRFLSELDDLDTVLDQLPGPSGGQAKE